MNEISCKCLMSQLNFNILLSYRAGLKYLHYSWLPTEPHKAILTVLYEISFLISDMGIIYHTYGSFEADAWDWITKCYRGTTFYDTTTVSILSSDVIYAMREIEDYRGIYFNNFHLE